MLVAPAGVLPGARSGWRGAGGSASGAAPCPQRLAGCWRLCPGCCPVPAVAGGVLEALQGLLPVPVVAGEVLAALPGVLPRAHSGWRGAGASWTHGGCCGAGSLEAVHLSWGYVSLIEQEGAFVSYVVTLRFGTYLHLCFVLAVFHAPAHAGGGKGVGMYPAAQGGGAC